MVFPRRLVAGRCLPNPCGAGVRRGWNLTGSPRSGWRALMPTRILRQNCYCSWGFTRRLSRPANRQAKARPCAPPLRKEQVQNSRTATQNPQVYHGRAPCAGPAARHRRCAVGPRLASLEARRAFLKESPSALAVILAVHAALGEQGPLAEVARWDDGPVDDGLGGADRQWGVVRDFLR